MFNTAVLRMALLAIAANRMRSARTVLGVVIGVAAVVALISLGQGATAQVRGAVEGLGSNLLVITPGGVTPNGFIPPSQAPITLTEEEELAQAVPAVKAMAPAITRTLTLAAGSTSASLPVEATTPDIAGIANLHVAAGRFFTALEASEGAPVAVLGPMAAEDLFGRGNPAAAVGSTVTIEGMPFTVVGVLASLGQAGTTNLDQVVYIPIATGMAELFGNQPLTAIYASARSTEEMAAAQGEITAALAAIEQEPPGSAPLFTVTSQTQVLSTLNTITSTLTAFLGAIAGIALLVGGIGIMNIMLVSVTERTREIGVRKAVGARRSDILAQFILEAVLLSAAGGVLGVLVGTLITVLGGRLFGDAPLSGLGVVLSLGFSLLVGVVFGAYHAHRASRLMPMQALRHE